MPVPAEIKARMKKGGDVKVAMKEKEDHAVIEGKTAVPFAAFVKLILQKKVQRLNKKWNNEPIIVSSDLLTEIASAPEDSHENNKKVIMTALVIGAAYGAFIVFCGMLVFEILGISITLSELIAASVVMLFLGVTVLVAIKAQKGIKKINIVEKVEEIAETFGK